MQGKNDSARQTTTSRRDMLIGAAGAIAASGTIASAALRR